MSILKSHKVDFRILDRPDVPIVTHAAGATIVSKGEPAHEMFLLRKGRVSIQLGGETVEEVAPGGIFGEMALIDHAPRSAALDSQTKCDTGYVRGCHGNQIRSLHA